MTKFSTGETADLLGVSVDTVRRWCDDGDLDSGRSSGGHRVIEGSSVAAFVTRQHPSTDDHAASQSARNRFSGIVTAVERDGIMAKVEIRSGRQRIVSVMTREAADELGLEPGALAIAAVKSTNVIIELPTS